MSELIPEEIKAIFDRELIPEVLHSLFETQRRVQIDEETHCVECAHDAVCDLKMERRCANYWFGTSTEDGCLSCTNHYARYDKEPIPCFYCPYFTPEAQLAKLTKSDDELKRIQLSSDRVDFHTKRMVGKKEYQIKSELIITLTEFRSQILNLMQGREAEAKKEERNRIIEWGDEDCPHSTDSNMADGIKRSCEICWQALKEE